MEEDGRLVPARQHDRATVCRLEMNSRGLVTSIGLWYEDEGARYRMVLVVEGSKDRGVQVVEPRDGRVLW